MTYRVGVEDIEPGQWVAWWFERPGITGGGPSLPEAVTALSRQVPVIPVEPIDVFRAYPSLEDPDYLVNAFFEDDRRPLSAAEIADGLARLHESRERLLGLIHSVGPPRCRVRFSIGSSGVGKWPQRMRGNLARFIGHLRARK